MVQTEPSLQQLNQRSVRAGFVGREAERALFLRNFEIPPGDDRHRFRWLRAAEPLWRELIRFLHEDGGLNELERAQGRCFVGCALGDWAEAERGLAEFLAATPDWEDRAYAAAVLTELRRSADADGSRLDRYLTSVSGSGV